MRKKGMISALQEVQKERGYLPVEEMLRIAKEFSVSPVHVYGIATFYKEFRFSPPGRHPIKVCLGTACHLAGGDLVLDALERELNIKTGERTKDGLFSLDRVACIGCCMLAPVILIGEKVYPKMSPSKVEEALIPFKS